MTDGRRKPRTNYPTKVPGIPKPPADASPSLQKYLTSLSEALEIRLGRKGDTRDRAITLRELIDSGLAVDLLNRPYDPNNPGSDFDPPPTTGGTDQTPTAPTGFSVIAGLSSAGLFWDYPGDQYRGHSFTELFRNSTNNIATAVLIGSSPGSAYTDYVGTVTTDTNYYYWARHVNTDGIRGPFHANAGLEVTFAPNINFLLDVLDNSITSSQLVQSLRDPISNLPTDTNQSFVDVEEDVSDLGAQYSVKIQTNFNGGTYVSGYGLSSELVDDTPTSSFVVAADRFAIINPATYNVGQTNNLSANYLPFQVETNSRNITLDSGEVVNIPAGVYIRDLFVSKAKILDLIAGSVTADFVLASTFIRAPAIHGGTFNIGSFSTNGSSDPTNWTVTGNNRQSNFSVDANGIMHCESAELKGITVKASDDTILLDAGGLRYGSGGQLAYNGNFHDLDDGWTALLGSGGSGSAYISSGIAYCGYQQYFKQSVQRFPVSRGEKLYVYAWGNVQGTATTGMRIGATFYNNSDPTVTSGSSGTVYAGGNGTGATQLNIQLDSNIGQYFAVGEIVVPNSANSKHAEFRFGNLNYSGTINFVGVGISRTPPQIAPNYASTYIRDLSVDTLQIAGNAVSVPLGDSDDPNSAFTANQMFVNTYSTFVNRPYNATNSWKDGVDVGPITWDNSNVNTRPEAVTVIANAVIEGTGGSTDFSSRMMQILVANNAAFTSNVARFGGTDAFTAQENRQIDDTSLMLNVTQTLSSLGMSSPLYFKVQVSNTDSNASPHGKLRNNGITVLASKK